MANTVNELIDDWLDSQLTTPYVGSVPDKWRKLLIQKGYTFKTLPEAQYKYFGDQGYTAVTISKRFWDWYNANVKYTTESNLLFARFTTQPTSVRKALINTLVVSLKSAGVWTKLDALYIMAAADSQAAKLNWIADQYNLTEVNAPTFTVDRGYTGDGSTSYLDTNFNPTTAGSPKFVQNSANMGLWSRTNLPDGAETSFDMGQGINSYVGRNVTTSGQAVGRPNAASGQVVGAGAYPGHVVWARSAAAVWEGYAQGIDSGGGTTASTALNNSTIRICAGNGSFGANQIAAAHYGSNLTAGEVLALYTALNTYLTAVGAA